MRALATIALALVTASAHADEFEARGRNTLIVDGIAGIGRFTVAYPDSANDEATTTQAGVLSQVPFARIGYHRFIARGLSLGASGQVLVSEFAMHFGRDAVVVNFAPRIGYATTIAGNTSFWLRAGPSITYGTNDDQTFGQVSLGGEAVLVTRLHPDFGLTFTTFIESGIAGRERDDESGLSRSLRLRTVGLSLGVLIAF